MTRWVLDRRRLVLITAVAAALVLLPAIWLDDGQQSAWASSLQAVGLVAALLFAAEEIRLAARTLESDRRDRQVDRVLAFHEELTTGSTGQARSRLARFLRLKAPAGDACLQVTRGQLTTAVELSQYPDDFGADGSTPRHDLTLLLRLFERVRIANEGDTLDHHLLVALLGRHAGWWDLAIVRENTSARLSLQRLAEWTEEYRADHASSGVFEHWGEVRRATFPRGPVQASSSAP